jgi:hypothetical protein
LVKLYFSGRITYLLLHGYMGESIKLEQGVPQGDVLSPYIFNNCVEILLMKICHTKELEGVKYAKEGPELNPSRMTPPSSLRGQRGTGQDNH